MNDTHKAPKTKRDDDKKNDIFTKLSPFPSAPLPAVKVSDIGMWNVDSAMDR